MSWLKATFRSWHNINYRLWASGSLVSNIGTWMQRTAQDWIVLTQLTDHNATSVGIVIALQFGPQIFLLPWTGFAADYFERRKLLLVTQSAMGLLALGLAVLTLTGLVQLWHVYVFALLLGCVTAFDSPARQTFVAELVSRADLANAVGLNSTSFNLARMIGPAIAGVLIVSVGTGWVFLINAASFAAVIYSLTMLRVNEMHLGSRVAKEGGSLAEGFHYVWSRRDIRTILLMFFLLGTFGLNFAIFISTMAVSVFQADASHYGLLTSMLAVGSVAGALIAAVRASPSMLLLSGAAAIFGLGFALSALMPNYWLFGVGLIIIGAAAQTFTTSANTMVQLSTEPAIRGRVMAIYLAIAFGGTSIGAPIVGWVADSFGPRWAMGVGAAAGLAAAMVGIDYLRRYRQLRVTMTSGRIVLSMTDDKAAIIS